MWIEIENWQAIAVGIHMPLWFFGRQCYDFFTQVWFVSKNVVIPMKFKDPLCINFLQMELELYNRPEQEIYQI